MKAIEQYFHVKMFIMLYVSAIDHVSGQDGWILTGYWLFCENEGNVQFCLLILLAGYSG